MCLKGRKILLSFDTEEFDLPREQGVDIPIEEAMAVSVRGTSAILDILGRHKVKATFFCTTTFAVNAPEIMRRIIDEGHEIASHGCDHTNPTEDDVARSKAELEKLFDIKIRGYRQPRMFEVNDRAIQAAGYAYNSSIHPAFIPGRYMHLDQPRVPFMNDSVLEIPASVSPWFRLPVFWLACHNYPFWIYRRLARWTLRHDGQFVIYFHPWEFVDLGDNPEWKIPLIIRRHSGDGMAKRLDKLISMFKKDNAEFVTYSDFTNSFIAK